MSNLDLYEHARRNTNDPNVLDKIWLLLCRCENMLPIIEKHIHSVSISGWKELCSNKWALPLSQPNKKLQLIKPIHSISGNHALYSFMREYCCCFLCFGAHRDVRSLPAPALV